jgi:transcriptional regulator with XRE-family HTH domain
MPGHTMKVNSLECVDWVHVHTGLGASLAEVGHPSRVGKNLRRLRESASLSQHKLAKMAKVSRATIAHIETGHTQWLAPYVTDRIAKVLGVEVGALLDDPGALVLVSPAGPHIPSYLEKYGNDDKPTREELDAVRRLDPVVWRNLQPSAEAIRAIILARRPAGEP